MVIAGILSRFITRLTLFAHERREEARDAASALHLVLIDTEFYCRELTGNGERDSTRERKLADAWAVVSSKVMGFDGARICSSLMH